MPSPLIARACPMSDDNRVVLVRRLCCSPSMYAPLGAVFLDHSYVHLHGSLYPMMDYMSRVYDGLHHPMSADAPWDSI